MWAWDRRKRRRYRDQRGLGNGGGDGQVLGNGGRRGLKKRMTKNKGRKGDCVSKGAARRAGRKSEGAILLSPTTRHLFSLPPRPEIKTSSLPAAYSAVRMPRACPQRRPPMPHSAFPIWWAGGRASGQTPHAAKIHSAQHNWEVKLHFLISTSPRSPFSPCHRQSFV